MLGEISVESRFSGLVQKLVDLEKKPLERLQHKKNDLQNKISNLGHLKNNAANFMSVINNLSNTANLTGLKTSSSNSSVVTLQANSFAQINHYDIVVSQMATSNKISSAGVVDQNAAMNTTGNVLIGSGNQSFTLSINDPSLSLRNICDQINNATDNHIIKASIVNVNDAQGNNVSSLILTAMSSGVDNSITLASIDGDLLTSLDLTHVLQAGKNAEFTLDGMTVSRNSNVVTDVLDGVTLNILNTSDDVVSLTVSEDIDSFHNNIKSFVDGYNSIMNELSTFSSDSNTRFIKNQLENLVHSPVINSGKLLLLSDIGIREDALSKQLTLDDAVLSDALNNSSGDVADLFSEPSNGIAKQFSVLLNDFLSDDGLINVNTQTASKKIRSIENNMVKMNERIKDTEVRLARQFSVLDSIVSGFERTSEYLQQQMNNIQNSGKKK